MPIPRAIFSPHQRLLILRDLDRQGVSCRQRRGVKAEFRYSATPKISDTRISWKARINGVWHEGAAPNVYDAVMEIERRVAA